VRKPILVSCALVLAACTSFPQTREDFLQRVRTSDSKLTYTDSHVAKRRFDDVVKTITQKANECFQADVTTRRTAGGMTTMNQTDEYRTTMRVVDKNRAELTSQIAMRGAILPEKMPPGGYFKAAMDIERITPSTTRLTYYGDSLSGSKAVWGALKEWSDGRLVACP